MRKMWSNGYINISIDVKPLVSTPQEEGFLSPELYAMLDENEKRTLQSAQAAYERQAASTAKTQDDQWKSGSTISNYDIDRQFDNLRRDESYVEELANGLKEKYGMKPPVR